MFSIHPPPPEKDIIQPPLLIDINNVVYIIRNIHIQKNNKIEYPLFYTL